VAHGRSRTKSGEDSKKWKARYQLNEPAAWRDEPHLGRGEVVSSSSFGRWLPNMRMQRTRRLASLGRSLRSLGSPLMRRPLGSPTYLEQDPRRSKASSMVFESGRPGIGGRSVPRSRWWAEIRHPQSRALAAGLASGKRQRSCGPLAAASAGEYAAA